MATWKANKSAALFIAASLFITTFSNTSDAQQFIERGHRSYPLQSASPAAVEASLRRFLADRVDSGDTLDIVSDAAHSRLLIRGSDEIQRLADQFIQAVDQPTAAAAVAQAQTPRNVRGYRVSGIEELHQKLTQLRQHFAHREDVRLAGEERTRQIVVHAPEDVHQQITRYWSNLDALSAPHSEAGQIAPSDTTADSRNWEPATQQLQLENITWQDLLRGLRSVQGQTPAVRSPQDGTLELMLASKTGNPTQLKIDQQNQAIQLNGPATDTQQWTRVVQAMDTKPEAPGELRMMGRLGDAQAATITRTISKLGGSGDSRATTPLPQRNAAWGGDVVQQMFGNDRQPLQLAQADRGNAPIQELGDPASSDVARRLMSGDATGSFLGPVRIEFLEGTDIFIVRGQKRDVDRVMQIINDLQSLTEQTEPAIEVVQLKHANSDAMAALINQLNADVLEARQGDISVTALVKPNALLLIGREAGVEAVKKIVAKLDVEASASDRFKVFKLTYLPSVDAERTINNLYNQTQQQQQAEDEPSLGPRVRAVADFRSNSIAVQGSPRDLEEIADLLEQIDVQGSATVSEVQVFQLKNAIALEVAEVLNNTLGTDQAAQTQGGQQGGQQGAGAGGNVNTQPYSSRRALMLRMMLDEKQKALLEKDILESGILSNVTVSSNDRANSIVVVAPKGSMGLIAEIIRQLDELPGQEAEIRVFPVINGDASTLIEMLDTLFAQDDNQDGPLVQSAAGTGESTLVPLRFALDPRTNSIIASGNGADLEVVEAILLKLDSSDVSRRRNKVVELQIQQADAVAAAITTFVQQKRQAIQGIAVDAISPFELLDQEVVVVSEPQSNKLIISATDRYFEDIMQIITDLDKRPDMVMVQCLIAEVALNSTEEMGVELGIQDSLLFNRSVDGAPGFNFNNQALGNNSTAPGSNRDHVGGQALSSFDLGRSNTALGYGGLVLSASNESVSVLIRALQEANRLDVLSRPQVMMLNNTTGEVQIGAQVPFLLGSATTLGTVQNNVEFREVGLILGVTPRISPDGLVVLDVLAEKSDLGSEADGVLVSPGVRLPQINTTRARTYVTARDGQTVILGGLISKERSAFERKVPYLADVPFFGRLFRTDGVTEKRSELMIILTPHIIRDEADIDRINSEEYARMSWCLGNVIETHGDIGPGRMYEEDVIYSEMNAQGDGNASPIMDQDVPAATPVLDAPSMDAFPLPTNSAAPPVPSTLQQLPQAGKSVLLNSPQNVTMFPRTKFRVWGAPKNEAASAPQRQLQSQQTARMVDYQSEPSNEVTTSHAIYRFDEVPEEN